MRCKVSDLYNMNKEKGKKVLQETEKAFLLERKGFLGYD